MATTRRLIRGKSPWLKTNTLAGASLLAIFVIALLLAFNIQKGVPFKKYDYVNVAFTDTGSLRVGDDVRFHSVREGQVSDITVGDHEAIVRMQLPSGTKIYKDATAIIRARSALGQAYVDVEPGSSSSGSLGDHTLPVADTRPQVQLDTLLDVFNKDTRTQAQHASWNTGLGLDGHSDDLSQFLDTAPTSLTDLGQISHALASNQADLPSTLHAAATLSQHISTQTSDLSALLGSSDQVLKAFATNDTKPLQQTIHDAPSTLISARSALGALQQPLTDTTSAVHALRPGLAALGKQTPDLQKTLTEGTTTLKQVPSVAKLAQPAVSSLASTSKDLRPFAPRFSYALERGQAPLESIHDYGNNAGLFFDWFSNALSQTLPNGNHYLRLDLVTGASAVGGSVPAPTPVTDRDPYPSPSGAYHEGGH